MIVTTCFPGDTNDILKWIQHDLYGESLSLLVLKCSIRYLAAISLVEKTTELWRQMVRMDGFDHRVLQDAHDKIAAYYRFAYNKSQMPLPFDPLPYEERLLQDWREFFQVEVRQLAQDDRIVRAILTVVAYQNTPAGYEAERELMRLLDERYGGYSRPEAKEQCEDI